MRTIALISLTLPLLLGACSSARDQLGITRESPDEFLVLKRAPLDIPPTQALPPPRPGAPRPQEIKADELARKSILGERSISSVHTDGKGERALLNQVGIQNNVPDIRSKIDEEAQILLEENKTVAQKILGITGLKQEPDFSVIDAQKELERLRQKTKTQPLSTEDPPPLSEE